MRNRRSRARDLGPLAVLTALALAAVACAVFVDAGWGPTALVAFGLYVVALRGNRDLAVLAAAVVAVAATVAIVLIEGGVETTAVALRIAVVLGALAAGEAVRSRRALHAAAREQELREREEEAERRVAEERLRIARELHDTLAHSLVAINVRSSVALDLGAAADPSAALRDIKDVSATALRDLRATLDLLRDASEAAPVAPASDLGALPELVDRARAAGLNADLDVELDGASVPSPIGAAAYRIVQEALTNVLRHADASRASVQVRTLGDALDVDVTDNGRGTPGAPSGLGIRGMAERSAALGGSLDVGPCEGRGWRVHAVLPLGRER